MGTFKHLCPWLCAAILAGPVMPIWAQGPLSDGTPSATPATHSWFVGGSVPPRAVQGVPSSSAPALGARYEVIQSPINIRDTFRFDRWTGLTDILVGQDDAALVWRQVNHEDVTPVSATGPRFQLTLSAVAAKGAYLVDTTTGRTWILLGNDAAVAWRPIR